MDQKKVVAYYDYTIPFYKLFWHKGTNAIHYGLWDEYTKSHTEALLNMNKVVAQLAEVKPEGFVLDAGCGVGGTSIWIAKHIGSTVSGITVSNKQKLKAEKYAEREGVNDKTCFSVQDFTHTNFSDNTFDAVIAIESVCYAEDKASFIKEAYRVLKPGGRLVVADGFLGRAPQTERERNIYQEFLRGFQLDNLAETNGFERAMRDIGFLNVEMFDKTKEIQKTAEYMHKLSSSWMWVNQILGFFKVVPHLMVDNRCLRHIPRAKIAL
jgi:tocopherol O-methyltransferase